MSKLVLGLLAALVSLSAIATDYVFSTKNVTITAHSNQPCSPKILALMTEEGKAQTWRAAETQIQGRTIDACWTQIDDKVLIIDIEGDAGFIPVEAFHPLKEA